MPSGPVSAIAAPALVRVGVDDGPPPEILAWDA